MKSFLFKCCAITSMAAFFLLNLTNSRKAALLGCLAAIAVTAIFMIKNEKEFFNRPVSFPEPVYVVSGLLISSVLACNFYSAFINSHIVGKISSFIGCTNKPIVLFLSIAGAVSAIPITAAGLSHFVGIGLRDFSEADDELMHNGNHKRTFTAGKGFLVLTGIYLAGISAIIRANVNYIDDMGRVAEGYRGWHNFSRFLSNGLSTLIHTDNYITDISPFTQLLAVLIVALAGIIFLYVVYERKQFTIWEILALIPLGLNPYFLECISYKFDAPFMALSILGAIAPLLYRKKAAWEYILAVSMGTVIMCTTYQAASGIFPMCVVFLMFRMWLKKNSCKQIFSFWLNSVAGFGIGMVFFQIVIMIPVDTYVSNSLPPLAELLPTTLTNFKNYFHLIATDFKPVWKWIFLLLCIGFTKAGFTFSRQKKTYTLLITIISGAVMFFLCFGIYPALAKPLFAPRGMYGFGIFITILCISVAEYQQSTAIRVPALTIAWIFFVFSLTYGNALYVQKNYTDFRIMQVITDLNDMEVFLGEKPVIVQISGSIGQSPVIRPMNKNYNILNRLIPITFRESWSWGQKQFFGYYGLKNVTRDASKDLKTYDLPIVKDTMYHTIYGNDQYVLIQLK